jgi:hypothetical protein
MDIAEMLRNKIEILQHQTNLTKEEEDGHSKAREWYYYKFGYNFGTKLGQLSAYEEILALLESEKY